MTGLKIGDLARQAGVNVQTIRYYERRGLLPKPPRTVSNYRMYPKEALLVVRFIKRAQRLGFTLKDIKVLLSLRTDCAATCDDVFKRAREKIREIDNKIEALRRMRSALSELMDKCGRAGSVAECPIVEALEDMEVNL